MYNNKKPMKNNRLMQHAKDVVGAGVTLGVGNVALGQMGQGAIGSQITSKAAPMIGLAGGAGFIGEIFRIVKRGRY